MKVELIIDEENTNDVITIKCNEYTSDIQRIHTWLQQFENKQKRIIGLNRGIEYYLELRHIAYFETDADVVFAHTLKKDFIIKQRLYELEKVLPNQFMRVSKSTILNLNYLYAIETTLGGPHRIDLQNTEKNVYVSRKYYPLLKEKLKERL